MIGGLSPAKERIPTFSGLLGILLLDENVDSIMDPVLGPIAGLKEKVVILNVGVKKLPNEKDLERYLKSNRIKYLRILNGDPSPSIGFTYRLAESWTDTFVNFYHPRMGYY